MTAQEYANANENVVLRYASQGAPAGQDVALLDETELPFDLDEVEGEVRPDGTFEATNLNTEGGAHGWRFSDWNHNYIYGLWLRCDAGMWGGTARRLPGGGVSRA
jgi:hypothetical protein